MRRIDVRPMDRADVPGALELNNAAVPNVNQLDPARLAELVELSSCAVAARVDDALAGFALVMAPGLTYESPNYRWFVAHRADFRYLDRIVVDTDHRRSGVGRALYQAVFQHARAERSPIVACEVNLEPPNPGSSAFHRSIGFVPVGQLGDPGDSTVVELLEAPA